MDDYQQLAAVIFEAVKSGNWALVACAVLIGLVWLIRKYGSERIPFLQTDAGGALLVLVLGPLGAVMNMLAAGQKFDVALLATGLKMGFVAAGGYATVKKILPWAIEVVKNLFAKKSAAVVGVEALPVLGQPMSKEQVSALDSALAEQGYKKNPDGTYTNLHLVKK